MQNIQFFIGCLLLLSIAACQGDSSESTTDSSQIGEPEAAVEQKQKEEIQLKVTIDNLRMRAEAGEKGKELLRLPEGTLLWESGEVSDFTTKVKLRGVPYDEPWIKVKTEQGQEGWVYAGGIEVNSGIEQEYSQRLLMGRLRSFFGAGLSEEIAAYRKAYQEMHSSKDFADAYLKGVALRDTIVRLLGDKIIEVDPMKTPNLRWLEQAMPGFAAHLVAEGTQVWLFADFKALNKKARQTQGKEDDRFTEICFQVHAVDSIEHFYPAWFVQTWDYGGHSLLGQGIHKKILDQMEAELNKSRLFASEMMKTKDKLINDITAHYTSYWETQEKITAELDDILNADYTFLSKEDKIELSNRRAMFDKPKSNKIKLNQRSGVE